MQRLTLLMMACVLTGCGSRSSTLEPAEPTPQAESVPELQSLLDAIAENAEREILVLATGAAIGDPWIKPHLQRRLEFLHQTANDPETGSWEDLHGTQKDCLELAAQLKALAIGRGLQGEATSIAARMTRLQSLLRIAGYEFDDSGREQAWNEDGSPREGYSPLLPP